MNKKYWNILFIILSFISILVSIAIALSVTDTPILFYGVFGITLVICSITLIINLNHFKSFYESQYFKNASSYLLTIILTFFLLGLINYIAFKLPLSLDLTANNQNSLSKKSKTILKSIDNIQISIFAQRKDFRQIDSFLEIFRLENSKITFKFVNAETNPVQIKKHNITKIPALLFQHQDNTKTIYSISELEIVNAIYQVRHGKKKIIYYTIGHEEVDFLNTGNNGASEFGNLIKNSNYQFIPLNLYLLKELPKNLSTLMIWGPKTAFFPQELELLKNFLKKGGKLLIAIDPQVNNDNLSNLRKYLKKEWALTINNNFIIDRLKHIDGSNGSVPIVAKYNKDHPLTKNFNHAIFFPLVSSIEANTNSPKEKFVSLLADSMPYPAAWADFDLKSLIENNYTYNSDRDFEGPISYVGLFDDSKTQIAAFGNSTFIINTYKRFTKNYQFLINTISWLTGNEELISIDSPAIKENPIFINKYQIGLIFYFSVLLAPILLFSIGAYLYFKWK